MRIMETKDIVRLVERWAPTIASHLAGPQGHIVLGILSTVYQTSGKFALRELADKIANDPVALKELELELSGEMKLVMGRLWEKVEGGANLGPLWAFLVVGLAVIVCVVVWIFNL